MSQVILLSAVPGVVVLVLLALLPNPTTQAQIDAAQSAQRTPLQWSALAPDLRRYLPVLALFCFAKASEAFIMLRGHELGMSTVVLLLLWAWLAALQSLTALVGAPVSDRMSKRTLTLLNWASLAVGYAALALAASPLGLWIAVSLYGLLSGISEGVERSLVSELAGSGLKGTAFGWYHMISGVAAIPAGLLFGLLWQAAGPLMAFGTTAAVALASALWLWRALPAARPSAAAA